MTGLSVIYKYNFATINQVSSRLGQDSEWRLAKMGKGLKDPQCKTSQYGKKSETLPGGVDLRQVL